MSAHGAPAPTPERLRRGRRDGDGDWRMRPARDQGGKWETYRAVWRDEPGCFMVDCSTVEAHPDYRAARAAVIARRREGN